MKKIFPILFFTVTVLTSFAQTKADQSEHLTFKGVPLNGTLDEYVSKMKQNGFKHLTTENGTAILNGEFAGYKDCYVGVSTLKQEDLVHKIAVIFPERETWSSLSSNYFSLKELLTEKYGNPAESEERFQSHTPKDDGTKMTQVKLGACEYYTIYETDKGTIQLSIQTEDATRCFVTLAYFDKTNSDKIKSRAKDDL